MTLEEFIKLKYYTGKYVIIPVISNNGKILFRKEKTSFLNPKLKKKDKYDLSLEKQWIESIYNKLNIK